MSFYVLQDSFEKIYYTFAQEPDKRFWTRLKEKTFALVEKQLQQLESRDFLCVHCLNALTVSAGPGYETSREWFQCLYNNVIDRLFLATSHLSTDRRKQILRLDTVN